MLFTITKVITTSESLPQFAFDTVALRIDASDYPFIILLIVRARSLLRLPFFGGAHKNDDAVRSMRLENPRRKIRDAGFIAVYINVNQDIKTQAARTKMN